MSERLSQLAAAHSFTNMGAWVRNSRKRLGLKQSKFALAVGVAQATVSRWENDLDQPRAASIAKISILLDASYSKTGETDASTANLRPIKVNLPPLGGVDPFDELRDDIATTHGLLHMLQIAAGATSGEFADSAYVIARQAIMMMENASEIVERMEAAR